MLQQTIYILNAIKTESLISGQGFLFCLVLKVATNLRFLLLWLLAYFSSYANEKKLLPRVLSTKIICLGFNHSRKLGKRVHTSKKRKASVRTYKTYVQKKCIFV